MAHLKRRFLPAWLFSAPITSTFLLNRHSHPYAHQQYLYVKYASVTRLGDLLHFGQLFKACGNNYFAHITHILIQFCKVVEIFHFNSEIIFGQLLQTFGEFLLVTLIVAKNTQGECCLKKQMDGWIDWRYLTTKETVFSTDGQQFHCHFRIALLGNVTQ